MLPLKSGEVLEFTANISKVSNVANLRLQIAGRGNFLGKSAWHLQAIVHTENPLRMLFELDDQFDSYSDTSTLASMQYEMRLSERGQKVESIQRMTASGSGRRPRGGAAAARVLPERDPRDDAIPAKWIGRKNRKCAARSTTVTIVRRSRQPDRCFGKIAGRELYGF
jgi:hypothetical protein